MPTVASQPTKPRLSRKTENFHWQKHDGTATHPDCVPSLSESAVFTANGLALSMANNTIVISSNSTSTSNKAPVSASIPPSSSSNGAHVVVGSSSKKKKRKRPKSFTSSKEQAEEQQPVNAKTTVNGQTSHWKKKNNNKEGSEDPQILKKELAPIRRNLPVFAYRSQICQLIQQNPVVLVIAETGSGKSTQIPAYLHETGFPRKHPSQNPRNPHPSVLCVTQPRRVAAVTVAERVAHELGCRPGTTVGHRVRFDDFTHPHQTQLVYLTDGILLREATANPLLTNYHTVILDEAHERSLQTDLLFGVVKRAMKAREGRRQDDTEGKGSDDRIDSNDENTNDESRDAVIQRLMQKRAQQLGLPPLRVVVMSATLDVETFRAFFPDAASIQIPGRTHPVQTVYAKLAPEDPIDAALTTALQIHHQSEQDGDILVFLPGQEEIESLAAALKQRLKQHDWEDRLNNPRDVVQSIRGIGTDLLGGGGASALVRGVLVCVLYAALPPEAQTLAFRPKPDGCSRKIILATNIAETSVTLDGVRFVIDTGLHKTRNIVASATGMESLTVQHISQAQAAQRAGRAGRVSAGYCFRLYTEEQHDALEKTTPPEILRVNLAQVVLQLKGMGVHDPRTFDFLTPPSSQSLIRAFELLLALGAIDQEMQLTDYGKKLARLPLDPSFGHLLLRSGDFGCTAEMLTSVAMMSAENVFYRPNNNNSEASQRAAAAHRRFASYEGDIPTLLNVYNAWRDEASYIHSAKGRKRRQQQQPHHSPRSKHQSLQKLPHAEWCSRNWISGRALVRAWEVRRQLAEICQSPTGLAMDISTSCGAEREAFFQAICAGLCLQVASRIPATERANAGGLNSTRGRYKTKMGGQEVTIHPTSVMFGRNPAPKCVVYTEILITKKEYIRGVTQIREEWLPEVAPHLFKQSTTRQNA